VAVAGRQAFAIALALGAAAAPGLARGADQPLMTVRAAPLPGPLARLDPGAEADCPGDSAAPQAAAVVLLADGRRFQVALEGAKVAFRSLPTCAREPAQRADAVPGARAARGTGTLREAWLAEPTLRYRHPIFARPEHAASLRVRDASGKELRYAAPPDAVIEDRLPRLARAWGRDVLLTVKSTPHAGAAVLVLDAGGSALQVVAESEPIGTPQRWLNPIGIADFDGDGADEVAAVVTPHIGGWLTLYRRSGARLATAHREPGFSNHAIGSDELRLAALLDANADRVVDLAVPGADRRTLRIVTFAGGSFRELQRIGHSAAIASAVVAADLDADGRPELAYALADGLLVVLTSRR